MKKVALPAGALNLLIQEHSLIRAEIAERLKTAFSHFAYAGAIAAFAIPAADKIPDWVPRFMPLTLSIIASVGLAWIAVLNMRWVMHGGAYVAAIEKRVNEHFGEYALGWEHYADTVRARSLIMIPCPPKTPIAPIQKILQDRYRDS